MINAYKKLINLKLKSISKTPLQGIRKKLNALPQKPSTDFPLAASTSEKTIIKGITNICKTADGVAEIDRILELELCLHPNEIEEFLGCTKTERLRWKNEGRFNEIRTTKFRHGIVSHSSLMSVAVLATELNKLRLEHDEQAAKNKSAGAKKVDRRAAAIKGAATRRENAERKKNDDLFVAEKSANLAALKENPSPSSQLRYLCIMIQFASRYAKSAHKTELHSHEWYAMKGVGLKSLLKLSENITSDLDAKITTSVYIPSNPHKLDFNLCDNHYDDFTMMRSNYGRGEYSILDYANGSMADINGCKKNYCYCKKVNHFYSLYYLNVDVDGYKFGYHTPVGIAQEQGIGFGGINSMKRVQHRENEEGFRFGRGVTELEELIIPPQMVIDELTRILVA